MAEEDKKSETVNEAPKSPPKSEVSTTKNENDNSEPTNFNTSLANKTYAELICREDDGKKKANYYSNVPLKDFDKLRKCRKGETTIDKPTEEPKTGKKRINKNFTDNVSKNMDGSKGEDVQKSKYSFGKKRFDYLDVNSDFSKTFKQEERPNTRKNMERRIKDCYMGNPMEILNRRQTEELNKQNRTKVLRSTKAFGDYMGSKKTKTIMSQFNRREPLFVDKITNNSANTLKKSILENRKTQPCFNRLKFRHLIVDGKNHVGYV